MSKSDDSRSLIEHTQSQQRRDEYWNRNETIEDLIRKCSRALERGQRKHYHYVAVKLRDALCPLLLESKGKRPRHYNESLADHEGWHLKSLLKFQRHTTAILAELAGERDSSSDSAPQPQGFSGGEAAARRCVEGSLQSCAAIAEDEEIIRDALRTRVDATMFGTKIGEHKQDAEQDLGDEVEAISLLSGALKTIHTGGTGQGKSAGVETEGEAYYLQNFRDGRDFKLIDPVGLRDGENWFYDIPLHESTLRQSRKEQDLPPSFAENPDRGPETYPEIEVLVPLTPGLSRQDLPFDADAEEFTVRPFTIPASAIRKRLLVSIMATKLTPEQENVVRSAYNAVNHRNNDWMLADIVEEVRSRQELNEQKIRPIINTLQELQQEGFIRTRDDDYTLDWDRIFTDTDTITVFSQAFVGNGDRDDTDEIAQFIAVGHVIEKIVKEREKRYGIAESVLLLREMWKVAPHNRRQSFDARAAALQEAIGHMLTELFRENRHNGIHLSCDTQYLSDLLKAIRELFNRYVVYNTDRDTVKDVFEWTANDKWHSFYNTLNPRPGQASVTGMVQPALDEDNRGIEFIGPMEYAGPGHHHFDEDRDHNGWRARCRYLTPIEACEECESTDLRRDDDLVTLTCEACGHEMTDLSMGRNEELRKPVDEGVEWDDEVPTKLTIDVGYDESSSPDVDYRPVAAFADACLEYQDGAVVKRADVRTAFNVFMQEHDRDTRDFSDQSMLSKFGKRLAKAVDGWDNVTQTKRGGENAYNNLRLTTTGERYLDTAMEGLDDAAAPLEDR